MTIKNIDQIENEIVEANFEGSEYNIINTAVIANSNDIIGNEMRSNSAPGAIGRLV